MRIKLIAGLVLTLAVLAGVPCAKAQGFTANHKAVVVNGKGQQVQPKSDHKPIRRPAAKATTPEQQVAPEWGDATIPQSCGTCALSTGG